MLTEESAFRNPQKPIPEIELVPIDHEAQLRECTDEEYKEKYGVDRPTHYEKVLHPARHRCNMQEWKREISRLNVAREMVRELNSLPIDKRIRRILILTKKEDTKRLRELVVGVLECEKALKNLSRKPFVKYTKIGNIYKRWTARQIVIEELEKIVEQYPPNPWDVIYDYEFTYEKKVERIKRLAEDASR